MYLNLRQERQKRQWTQKFVANEIGITKASIQMLETGQRKPSYDVLVKLLYLFGYKSTANTIVKLFAVVDDTHNLL